MNASWTIDLAWWISAIELPALGGLFWLIWRTRREGEQTDADIRRTCELEIGSVRAEIAAYKLEVAKSYASIDYLKDVDKRLSGHLETIEEKLDALLTSRIK